MNPNDIIDAYNELRRLADILGTDMVADIVERVRIERAIIDDGIKPLATLQPVGEQGPEPVTLATGGVIRPTNEINISVNDDPDGRIYKAITGKEPKPPVNDGDTPCPWCTLHTTQRRMWKHVNNAHRDDLEQLYAEDGIKGIQTVFDLPYQTAYGWAQRIDGEAA